MGSAFLPRRDASLLVHAEHSINSLSPTSRSRKFSFRFLSASTGLDEALEPVGYLQSSLASSTQKTNPMIPTKTSLIITCCLSLAALPCAFAGHTEEHSADAMFKSMDTDGDGRVSRAEHAAGAKKMFDEMDANHDGSVTAAEMTACHEMKGDKPAKDAMSSADKIKVMDTNGDGQLSKAEHDAGADAMFTKMDTDGDGFLSASECKAGHDGMMKNKKSAK